LSVLPIPQRRATSSMLSVPSSSSSRAAVRRWAASQLHQEHYRLTLWCEHPGHEYPWDAATYNLSPPKEWFARIAPHALLIVPARQPP
jgi:hypothetical protein